MAIGPKRVAVDDTAVVDGIEAAIDSYLCAQILNLRRENQVIGIKNT